MNLENHNMNIKFLKCLTAWFYSKKLVFLILQMKVGYCSYSVYRFQLSIHTILYLSMICEVIVQNTGGHT